MAEAVTHEEGWRYETKLTASSFSLARIQSALRLHPAAFREAYAPRVINNLYFDTPERALFYAHTSGSFERMKVRVRWYGDRRDDRHKDSTTLVSPALEIKIKRGSVGTKLRFNLASIERDALEDPHRVSKLLAGADVPVHVRAKLAGLEPALYNRYSRRYYECAFAKIRATLDDGIEFQMARSAATVRDGSLILEVKYSPEVRRQAEWLIQQLPLGVSRNSKYVAGLLLVQPA